MAEPIVRTVPEKQYQKAFYAILVATTVFRLFYIQWVELAPDEAYYYTWSRNLQWGYYDHPPMVGFLIYLFTAMAGEGEFGLRLGWVLIGSLLTVLLYRMGTKMFGGERAGFFAALLMNLSLLGSTGAVIVTPDGPQGLFWVLALFSVYKAVDEESGRGWYGTGFFLGLGLLSKYTMILFVPCVLFFLLSSAEGRKWLWRKEPYFALLLGLLLFSPVILWNAQHDWISFRMQLAHGLEIKKAAGWRTFGDFWAGQAGIVSPLLFLAVLWATAQSGMEGFGRQKKNFLFLFWTSAPILLFFACTSLRSRVEANWPAVAYFSAVLALAGIAGQEWPTWKTARRVSVWIVVGSALLVTFLAHLQPIHALVPIPAKDDPTSQLYGWRILGARLQEAARTMDPARPLFLLTPRHQLVGQGMFYTQARFAVYQWNAPQRINHLSAGTAPPAGSQAIFFDEDEEELPAGVAALFSACEKAETVIIRRDSIPIRSHPIWKCKGFKGLQ